MGQYPFTIQTVARRKLLLTTIYNKDLLNLVKGLSIFKSDSIPAKKCMTFFAPSEVILLDHIIYSASTVNINQDVFHPNAIRYQRNHNKQATKWIFECFFLSLTHTKVTFLCDVLGMKTICAIKSKFIMK